MDWMCFTRLTQSLSVRPGTRSAMAFHFSFTSSFEVLNSAMAASSAFCSSTLQSSAGSFLASFFPAAVLPVTLTGSPKKSGSSSSSSSPAVSLGLKWVVPSRSISRSEMIAVPDVRTPFPDRDPCPFSASSLDFWNSREVSVSIPAAVAAKLFFSSAHFRWHSPASRDTMNSAILSHRPKEPDGNLISALCSLSTSSRENLRSALSFFGPRSDPATGTTTFFGAGDIGDPDPGAPMVSLRRAMAASSTAAGSFASVTSFARASRSSAEHLVAGSPGKPHPAHAASRRPSVGSRPLASAASRSAFFASRPARLASSLASLALLAPALAISSVLAFTAASASAFFLKSSSSWRWPEKRAILFAFFSFFRSSLYLMMRGSHLWQFSIIVLIRLVSVRFIVSVCFLFCLSIHLRSSRQLASSISKPSSISIEKSRHDSMSNHLSYTFSTSAMGVSAPPSGGMLVVDQRELRSKTGAQVAKKSASSFGFRSAGRASSMSAPASLESYARRFWMSVSTVFACESALNAWSATDSFEALPSM
mmetsp:Transcript_64389/g.153595  ORF Transcript_64389/g.153595 Transcript_64389/m.153595 type:complete len:535 (-) Transcript_64389:728-2332(-)